MSQKSISVKEVRKYAFVLGISVNGAFLFHDILMKIRKAGIESWKY